MQIISGKCRGRKIQAPKGAATRPTSSRLREALFNIVQHYIEEATFLDLYAGSGAMGLEALSRGADQVTFIDNSREAISCIQANAKALQLESRTNILKGDIFRLLDQLAPRAPFDIVFADAPYTQEKAPSLFLLQFFDKTPLLKTDGMLFIEDVLPKHPIEKLQTIRLISERHAGPSFLHQYQKMAP
ncbi:putative rRNA methyltransferase YlbH [Chlamydiales bacterium STE3]|nr:putative rRNA methyltransferase YlbH [Chlamydiales bacterium STE3]